MIEADIILQNGELSRFVARDFSIILLHSSEFKKTSDVLEAFENSYSKVNIFNEFDDCFDHITNLSINHPCFLILADFDDLDFILEINDIKQISSIYIYNEHQTEDIYVIGTSNRKVRGSFHQMPQLLYMLKLHIRQLSLPSSIFSLSPPSSSKSGKNELASSFMYTQLFKEVYLTFRFDRNEKLEEFIQFCEKSSSDYDFKTNLLDEFKKSYRPENALEWYTRGRFLYENVNRALREQDFKILMQMGFFIQDLHRNIEDGHKKQNYQNEFDVFRGQGLKTQDLLKLQRSVGSLIGFNCFLSTSRKKRTALFWAESSATNQQNIVGVLFKIRIRPSKSSAPFVELKNVSHFKDEEEVLFAMHTIFRIVRCNLINKDLWQIELSVTDDHDTEIVQLTEVFRRELFSIEDDSLRLAKLSQCLGIESSISDDFLFDCTLNDDLFWNDSPEESLVSRRYSHLEVIKSCKQILDKIDNGKEENFSIVFTIHRRLVSSLMAISDHQGAIQHLEQMLIWYDRFKLSNPHNLLTIYYNLGLAKIQIGLYKDALNLLKSAFTIEASIYHPNHPEFVSIYIAHASIYHCLGQLEMAAEAIQKASAIAERSLPENHLLWIKIKVLMAVIHMKLGNYQLAMDSISFAEAMVIKNRLIGSEHGTIVLFINGAIHIACEKHDVAIEKFQEALNVSIQISGENSRNTLLIRQLLAQCSILDGKNEDSIASLQEILKIQSEILPVNHPDIIIVHFLLADALFGKGYLEPALEHAEKVLRLLQKSSSDSVDFIIMTHLQICKIQQNLGNLSQSSLHLEEARRLLQKYGTPGQHYFTELFQLSTIQNMFDSNYQRGCDDLMKLKQNLRTNCNLNSPMGCVQPLYQIEGAQLFQSIFQSLRRITKPRGSTGGDDSIEQCTEKTEIETDAELPQICNSANTLCENLKKTELQIRNLSRTDSSNTCSTNNVYTENMLKAMVSMQEVFSQMSQILTNISEVELDGIHDLPTSFEENFLEFVDKSFKNFDIVKQIPNSNTTWLLFIMTNWVEYLYEDDPHPVIPRNFFEKIRVRMLECPSINQEYLARVYAGIANCSFNLGDHESAVDNMIKAIECSSVALGIHHSTTESYRIRLNQFYY